jgi:cytoskeletal protein CcmA (bactofilin family)
MFAKQASVLGKGQDSLADRRPLPLSPSAGNSHSAQSAPASSQSSQTASQPLHPTSQNAAPAQIRPASTTPQPEADATTGSRLIVGPDVKLKGAEILDCDTLVVEGRVEAVMDSRVIRITENGAFCGKVGIDVAEVFGEFDGDLTARQQLVIHSTGRVSGKIRYGKLLVEEGGSLSGDIQSISGAALNETQARNITSTMQEKEVSMKSHLSTVAG